MAARRVSGAHTTLHPSGPSPGATPSAGGGAVALEPLRDFLSLLAGSDEGQIVLVNLWDSCDSGLLDKNDVLRLLDGCASHTPTTPAIALAVFDQVSASRAPAGVGQFRRLCKQHSIGGRRLRTTTTYSTFVDYHVDPDRLPGSVPVLPVPAPSSVRDQLKLQRDVQRITAASGWHRAEATLGRPLPDPNNCWLTVEDDPNFEPREPLPSPGATDADAARDSLGLIDCPAERHLVAYSFDAPSSGGSAFDMARPTATDGGNRRFRVKHSCDRGKAMAAAGWGCTVDLSRVPERDRHPVGGRPERVTRALELSELAGVQVSYLRACTVQRGATSADNDSSFVKILLGRRQLSTVVRKLLGYIGS